MYLNGAVLGAAPDTGSLDPIPYYVATTGKIKHHVFDLDGKDYGQSRAARPLVITALWLMYVLKSTITSVIDDVLDALRGYGSTFGTGTLPSYIDVPRHLCVLSLSTLKCVKNCGLYNWLY